MSEIRKDPILGSYVILARARQKRPNDFIGNISSNCPFCAGNEKLTPPELYAEYDSNGKWLLRVVPNKFPALKGDKKLSIKKEALHEILPGSGRHEVLIETPRHNQGFEKLPSQHLSAVLKTYAKRASEMLKIDYIKYVIIFKNHGKKAGASLSHPHSQIVGLPIAPKRIIEETRGCIEYKAKHGSCVFCDIAKAEGVSKKRVIAENEQFIAIAPYASRFPFEQRILPKRHLSNFENLSENEAIALAEVLGVCIKKLSISIPNLSYNMMIHSSIKSDKSKAYHWNIEIAPKLVYVAGFEWGSGFYINSIAPEQAAEILNKGLVFKL